MEHLTSPGTTAPPPAFLTFVGGNTAFTQFSRNQGAILAIPFLTLHTQ